MSCRETTVAGKLIAVLVVAVLSTMGVPASAFAELADDAAADAAQADAAGDPVPEEADEVPEAPAAGDEETDGQEPAEPEAVEPAEAGDEADAQDQAAPIDEEEAEAGGDGQGDFLQPEGEDGADAAPEAEEVESAEEEAESDDGDEEAEEESDGEEEEDVDLEAQAYDTMSTARSISLGTTYSGSITSSNSVDFYKFTLPSSGRISITGSAYFRSSYYHLYNSSGQEIWYQYKGWDSTTGMQALSWDLDLVAGTYYFSIERYEGTGSYSFKISFTSANESFSSTDNSMGSANAISLGSTYRGQIARNDEKDFYKFVLPSSGKIAFTGTAYISNSYYHIYNSAGQEVWDTYKYWDSTSGQQVLDFDLDLTKGTYYLCVERYWEDNTGNYNFKLAFTSAGESFAETQGGSNNALAAANSISLNTVYKGQLALNDDRDFYKFSVGSTGNVRVTGSSYMDRTYYHIYNASGQEVWWDSCYRDSASGKQTFSWDVELSRGTYYFNVESEYNTGNYNFSISGRYAITKYAKGGGKIELQSSTMYPTAGSKVTFRTLPNLGQTLKAFNVTYKDPKTGETVIWNIQNNGITRTKGTGAAGTKSEYTFTMPPCNCTINATFVKNTNKYEITKDLSGAGVYWGDSNLMLVGPDGRPGSGSPAPTMYPTAGSRVYFKSVPASGARLTRFNVTYTYTGLDGKKQTEKLITGSGITSHGGGLYSFVMPCYPVTLTGEFSW